MMPFESTAIPSAALVLGEQGDAAVDCCPVWQRGHGSGMSATTFPSRALPMRMPRFQSVRDGVPSGLRDTVSDSESAA
jgi:hypothetical protein